jgi:hypothetical protein
LSGNLTIEGPAKFQKGETSILFLYKGNGYGGYYTTMGMEQGKYHIYSNGTVESKLMDDMKYWPQNGT